MFSALSFISKMNYIFCALLLITAYLLMTSPKNCQQEEVIDSLDKGIYSYQKYVFIILLLGLIMINFIIMIIMILLSLNNAYFLFHFIKPYLYNMFIPQFICLSFAFILSLFKNHIINIILMIVFIFMISPLSEMSWPIQPSFPVDKIYHIIHLPFEIFYQNSDWAVDVLYGLQTELTRLWIFILWICLFIAFYFIKMNVQPFNHSKRYSWGYKATIILTAGSCFMMYMPECKYRLNDSWDGYNYDINQNQEPVQKKIENLDYKISQYDLTINMHRMLEIDGKIHLQSSTPRKDFILTLYQNYDILDLKGSKDFTFDRSEDYIYIHFDQSIQDADLSISYRGYHPKFYSNSQAAMLPGYFPWYPMGGERQVFLHQEVLMTNGYSSVVIGYNINNKIDKAKITLHCDRQYITNLDEIEKGVYSGTSDSISLFDGYTEPVHYQNIINYLPMNGTLKTKEKYLSDVYNNYMNEINLIENIFDISLEEYRSKKIIDVSEDIWRNMNRGRVAIFDDYVIVSQISNVCHLFGEIVQTSDKMTPLIYSLGQLSIEEDAEKVYQGLIEKLEMYEAIDLQKKLETIYQKLGAKRLLHELYNYCFDDTPADDQKFIERLGVL